MGYSKIPDELKREKAWVNVWNTSKIPMQSTQTTAASTSVPATWSDFNSAVNAVNNGVYDGIGYVFHDDGLVGIDIDAGFCDCFLSPLAIDIVGACESYCEKSRSGRGVHILLRGNLPFKGKNNRAGVEIYRTSRYFIMTGEVLVYDKIINNQQAIDYVLEKYFADTPKESDGCSTQKIYTPSYRKPQDGVVRLQPDYPVITTGGRNISLTSLAGQLHNQGYHPKDIADQLLVANTQACKPPLSRGEVLSIVNSVTRYRR